MKSRIQAVRKANGLSMEAFGNRLKISKAAVSRIESGVNNPSEQTLSLICTEFGVSEDWLRTGEGEMKQPVSIDEQIIAWIGRMQLSEDVTFQKRVALALAQMTEEGWTELEKLAKAICERD